ncbi:hypothetical protein IBX73_06950 [candidate division WOR-3 bacterium]|nr:hypothetical protein [candidate division WOR-3 bacterium]
MLVLYDRADPVTRDSVCGIGGFDGVHRGHQAIAGQVRQIAGTRQKAGIITFRPLPLFVLKRIPAFYLTPEREKEELFEQLGIDFIFYFEFSETLARQSPPEFIAMVEEKIGPSVIVAGDNFHFGSRRKGTAQILQHLGMSRFDVRIVPGVVDESIISSTRVRELLMLGNVRTANRLLGRAYVVSGRVSRGKGTGTKLGFPTINVIPPPDKLLPLEGVYKAEVFVDYGDPEYLGALFCRHDLIEVHMIGFSGDLYGKNVNIRFIERIRAIEHFADDRALAMAIASDIKKINP